MRAPLLLPVLLLILVLSLFAGCSSKDPEDVKVTIEGDKLVIVNHSGADIYYYNNDVPGRPWVPASAPNIRIADGERRIFDLDAPGVRENGVRVNWWHRGRKNSDSEYFGADRVRTVLFDPAAVIAVLPTPPDPAIEQAAAANLATVCRERVVLEAWTDRRARNAEPSATPPDPSAEGIPSGCRDILRDCTAANQCANRLAGERRALDAARAAAGIVSNTGVGLTAAPSASSSVVNELASVCRERTLLDAWIGSPMRKAGDPSEPPDFSAAAVPWSCRDLVRDCETRKSCPARLAEQTALLNEVRGRATRQARPR